MAPLFIRFGTSERIDAVVLWMSAMTLHPMPFDSVRRRSIEQLLPELRVLDRLLVRRAPPVLAPFVDPSGDPIADVNAIGVKVDTTWPLERRQAFYGGLQLHAVVGRKRFASTNLAFLVAHAQKHRPAPWPGISAAGTVSEHLHCR